MTTEQLIAKRIEYKIKLKEIEDSFSLEFTKDFQDWLTANIPYKTGQVVEHTDGKRRKYNRFVIYDFQPTFLTEQGHMFVSAWGWYLDKDNVPAKWSNLNMYGTSNPAEIVLSPNQKNKYVPK